MNDNELQEYKQIYIKEAHGSADDEIGLVDLIIALGRRWKLMTIIFVCIIMLGTVYALNQPKQYTYSTTLMVGTQIINGTFKPFPTTDDLVAKIQYSHIPRIQQERKSSNTNDTNKYKIEARTPTRSNIVVLEVHGEEQQSDSLLQSLHDLTQSILQDYKQSYEDVKQYIIASRESAKAELALLNSNIDRQSDMSILIRSKIDLYNLQLAYLKNIQVISPPTKSSEPTSRSKALIIIAAAFAGIALAVFSAFIAELVSKVKQQL